MTAPKRVGGKWHDRVRAIKEANRPPAPPGEVRSRDDAKAEFLARKAAEHRDAQRLAPSLDDFLRTLLGWDPNSIGTSVRDELKAQLTPIPKVFRSASHYQDVFYPLLKEECRATIENTLTELMTAHATAMRAAQRQQRESKQGGSSIEAPPTGVEVFEVRSISKIDEFHVVDLFDSYVLRSRSDPFRSNILLSRCVTCG